MKWLHLTVLMVLVFTQGLVNAAKPQNDTSSEPINILLDALVVCPPDSPTRFVDNGDGTICDHQTGLMWEKKNAADGVRNLDNPHDVDNYYWWGDDSTRKPDSTVFTDFLARLNGEIAGTARSEQLSGYSDWRLPTSAELQTLLFEPYPCSISPCIIDPIFAPVWIAGFTPPPLYWTSSMAGYDVTAISFKNGYVLSVHELDGGGPARAVRGSMSDR